MDDNVTRTIELLGKYTDEKPSADAVLIASQISALVDATQRVAKQLEHIDYSIDNANQ
jgi:hypothetical protein